MPLKFTLEARCPETGARAGRFETDHGMVETPMFMPVGTAGSVKALSPRALREDIRAQIVLANTYHLYLRPGRRVMEESGGLHRFMAWEGPILTDSGGFQVFSLSDLREVSDDGVTFQSHLDGSTHTFTPENVIDIQRDIGSDIMMVLDECPPATIDEASTRESNSLTVSWARRAFARYRETESTYGHHQALFPIVQGAVYPAIRRESANALLELDAEGYAIGGLSVGEEADVRDDMVEIVNEILPSGRPRYLMGVGTPEDLIESVARGVDLFDCVMPTRNGRNGSLFTTEGRVNIRNARWEADLSSIDPGLDHYAARTFSKAYLRHLTKCDEPLFMEIASMQNLAFYLWLMAEMRRTIMEGRFPAWRREWTERVSRRL